MVKSEDGTAASLSVRAASNAVRPVVTTSSTNITSWPGISRCGRKPGSNQRRAVATLCPARAGHHQAGPNPATTGSPEDAATAIAKRRAGSMPCRQRRSVARGIGTRQSVPGGMQDAMAAANHRTAVTRPLYLTRWTATRAGPSWTNGAFTTRPGGNTPAPDTKRSAAGTAAARQPWQTPLRTPPIRAHTKHMRSTYRLAMTRVPSGFDRQRDCATIAPGGRILVARHAAGQAARQPANQVADQKASQVTRRG